MPQEGEAGAEGQKPEAQSKEGQEPQPQPKAEGKTFDEAYVKELRSEAAESRKAKKELETKLAEFEDRDKSELEKLTGKLSKAEERANAAENRLLRFRVAAEKQLPADLIDRLQGSTEEELSADADKLLQLVKKPEEKSPEFDGGAREPAPEAKSPEDAHRELVSALLGPTTQ